MTFHGLASIKKKRKLSRKVPRASGWLFALPPALGAKRCNFKQLPFRTTSVLYPYIAAEEPEGIKLSYDDP
jgi:hypothetical protein